MILPESLEGQRACTLLGDTQETLRKVVEQFEKDGYAEKHPWHEHAWDVMWAYPHPYGGPQAVAPHRLRADQLVNRYPSSPFVSKSQLAQLPFDFIPRSFEVPEAMGAFSEAYRVHPEKLWVRKNRSHRGVRVTSPHETALFLERSSKPIFVQEFIQPPHLICGRKWDMGVYVLLTSLHPLRLYAYTDIVLRFCPRDHGEVLSPEDLGSYVVADDYTSPWELAAFAPHREGHRTAADMLRAHLSRHEPELEWTGALPAQCLGAIRDVVGHHAGEMWNRCAEFPGGQHQFFELYRFDFLFDDRLGASLMEVNMSPNLSPRVHSDLDDLFTRLVADVFGLVGISDGPEALRARRRDPDLAAAAERARCERWIPVTPEMGGRAGGRAHSSRRATDPGTVATPSPAPLGDAPALRFSLHGACVQVELPSEAALRDLQTRLPPGARLDATAPPDVGYRITPDREFFRDGELRLRAQSTDEVLEAFLSDLHFQLACHARTALFVHAGVVAQDGQAILFPGRSHSGKSTLVAALVEAGASYYSDEYAVLDERGRVHPYLKPISLRDVEGIAQPHSVASLGGHCGTEPVPVGLIVHTRYEPDATWAPRPLPAGQALLAMVDNTVRAREKPALMLDVLAEVVGSASAIASSRGEAAEVVRDLMQRQASVAASQDS